jgi:hypothetical protein
MVEGLIFPAFFAQHCFHRVRWSFEGGDDRRIVCEKLNSLCVAGIAANSFNNFGLICGFIMKYSACFISPENIVVTGTA